MIKATERVSKFKPKVEFKIKPLHHLLERKYSSIKSSGQVFSPINNNIKIDKKKLESIKEKVQSLKIVNFTEPISIDKEYNIVLDKAGMISKIIHNQKVAEKEKLKTKKSKVYFQSQETQITPSKIDLDNKISEENNRIELINDLKEYTKKSNKAEVLKAERNEESDEDLLRIQTPAEYDRMYGDIYNKDMCNFEDESERRERYLDSIVRNQQRYFMKRLDNLNKSSYKCLSEIKEETLKMKQQMTKQ